MSARWRSRASAWRTVCSRTAVRSPPSCSSSACAGAPRCATAKPDHAHRLARRRAAGARDAGHGDGQLRLRASERPLGHRARHLRTDRAVGRDQRRRHAQQLDLAALLLTMPRSNQSLDPATAGARRRDQSAGARLSRREHPAAGAQCVAEGGDFGLERVGHAAALRGDAVMPRPPVFSSDFESGEVGRPGTSPGFDPRCAGPHFATGSCRTNLHPSTSSVHSAATRSSSMMPGPGASR